MSIETTLESITQHIKDDYTSLENLGETTEDKNIENIAGLLDNLYTRIPKTTGEDTSLSLTTLKGKMNIIPKGDTYQDTTTGINLMDVSAVGSGTRNGITLTNNGDGTFTLNGTATAQNLFTLANMTLDTSKTYTLTGCPSGGSSTTYFIAGANFGDYGSGATAIPNRESISFSIVTQSGAVLNNVVFKPMLIEGSTQKPFEPFTGNSPSPSPSYPQDIEVVTGTQEVKVENKNILKFTQTKTATSGGLTATCNDNTTITINGTSSSMVAMAFEIDTKVLNGTYKLSGYTRSDTYVQLYTKNSSGTIRVTNMRNTPTITFDNETLFQVFIFVANGTTATFNNETFNLQLEKGSTATTYVEHQEQTQTISLGDIELCKIGNYQEYLYKSNDKWYKKENIGKVIFNGSETGWERNTTTLGYRYRINQTDIKPNTDNSTIASMYCNYLRATSPDRLYNTDNYSISCFSGTSHVIIIACVESSTDTLEKWKTWLSTHNTIVYYLLETPNDIEITNTTLIEQLDNLEKLKSYNGVTNISSSGNLSAILSVSALKGE